MTVDIVAMCGSSSEGSAGILSLLAFVMAAVTVHAALFEKVGHLDL